MRNRPAASTTVALLDVPPLSSPTATHELEPKTPDSTDPALQTGARAAPQISSLANAAAPTSGMSSSAPLTTTQRVRDLLDVARRRST